MNLDRSAEPNGLRVLVVEDEYLVADDISETLQELGYQVAGPAATVSEAMTLIEQGSIDCALLDANLDGLSSSPVAELLASLRIPYVVVTGYGNLSLATAELQNAPRVTKPYASGELASKLSELVRG
jgi:CheY-like chemotaxis protein